MAEIRSPVIPSLEHYLMLCEVTNHTSEINPVPTEYDLGLMGFVGFHPEGWHLNNAAIFFGKHRDRMDAMQAQIEAQQNTIDAQQSAIAALTSRVDALEAQLGPAALRAE